MRYDIFTGTATITGNWLLRPDELEESVRSMFTDMHVRLENLTEVWPDKVTPANGMLQVLNKIVKPDERLNTDIYHLRWMSLLVDSSRLDVKVPIWLYALNFNEAELVDGQYNFRHLPVVLHDAIHHHRDQHMTTPGLFHAHTWAQILSLYVRNFILERDRDIAKRQDQES